MKTADLRLVDAIYGKGVIASNVFRAGERILEFFGPRLHKDELPTISSFEDDRYLQVGPTEYIGESNGLDDFINHSCDPNCKVVITSDKVFLEAIVDIEIGDEITFDYSTTMAEDDWELDCLCDQPQCRGRVRDFKTLPGHIKEKYIKLGAVPDFVMSLESLG
jgi:SET domain-containing protein